MKAISRWLDRFCYNHPNFGIPNLMKFIVIGNVLVYFLDMFSRGYVSWLGYVLPRICLLAVFFLQPADSAGTDLADYQLYLCSHQQLQPQ